MAIVKKTLTLVNEELRIDIPTDRGAILGVEYGAAGLGTIVLEGSVNGGQTWPFAFQLSKVDGTAAVANLAAAGAGWADVSMCDVVRIRKSVAGAGPVDVFASLTTKAA